MSKQIAKLIARIAENMPEMPNEVMQHWIDHPGDLKGFLRGMEGVFGGPFHLRDTPFDKDCSKDGWSLVKDPFKDGFEWSNPEVSEGCRFGYPCFMVEAVQLQKRRTMKGVPLPLGSIKGEVFQNFSDQKGVASQRHLEALLREPELIPTTFTKRGFTLVAPRTVWQRQDGYRVIPVLFHCHDGWAIKFEDLGGEFSSSCRLLRTWRSHR